jgi:hypothetical protein
LKLLFQEPMKMREKISDFMSVDLARLNLYGWLLMLASLGIVVGGVVLIVQAGESEQAGRVNHIPRWLGYLCWGAAALFFFGGQWALDALGLGIYRQPKEKKIDEGSPG